MPNARLQFTPVVRHETWQQSREQVPLLLQVAAVSVIADQDCLQAPAAAPSHEVPPADAAAWLAELPFSQEECLHSALCLRELTEVQVQEVEEHLKGCITPVPPLPLPGQAGKMHWHLVLKRIMQSSGVPPLMVCARTDTMASGGCGSVSL